MDFVILLFLAGIFGLLLFQFFKKSDDKKDDFEKERENLIRENAEFKTKIENLISEKSEISEKFRAAEKEISKLSENGKIFFTENQNLKNENQNLRAELSKLEKIVAKFESEKAARDREFAEKLEKLEAAKKSFEAEKARVAREDAEKTEKMLAEQNRLWNDHENRVLSRLRDLCQNPEIGFSFFENTNLPPDFDAKLKPDFLIDFLGQYLIFDAKKSRDPRNYFREQCKKTAAKYQKNPKIYRTIFFLFPADEISKLEHFTISENGFVFHAIPIESLEAILRNFRKIADYENLENFDPEDREKIVNFIADLQTHINVQNVANVILTQKSHETLEKSRDLSPEIADEIAIKMAERHRNLKNFNLAEMKNLFFPSAQKNEIQKLIAPKAAVEKSEIAAAERLFE